MSRSPWVPTCRPARGWHTSTLTSGETTVEARARITFPTGRDGAAPPAQAEPEASDSSMAWPFVAGGLATLVLLAVLNARRRRRRRRPGMGRPGGQWPRTRRGLAVDLHGGLGTTLAGEGPTDVSPEVLESPVP